MRKTSDILWQDAQHQMLFEILDSLAEPGDDIQVLNRLRYYTETHFSLEEQYMERLDYPEREAHVRSHNRFRDEIDKLLAHGPEPDPQLRDLVATFLTQWLTRHVFGIDKDLEAFILASDRK
jgi:hemerythrin